MAETQQPWMKVAVAIPTSPKTLDTAEALHICVAQLIGHLSILWAWAFQHAPDGNLAEIPNKHIARGAMWGGDAEEFVGVLREFCWIDDDGHLHEWEDWGGALHAQRQEWRERKSKGSPRVPQEVSRKSQRVHTQEKSREEKSREELLAAKPPPGEQAKRLWSCFVDALGYEPQNATERGKWNKGIKACRQSSLAPAEVADLVAFCRRSWPDVPEWNPMSCSGHITQFRRPKGPGDAGYRAPEWKPPV